MNWIGQFLPGEAKLPSQKVFKLSNHVRVTVEDTPVFGSMVVKLEDGMGAWNSSLGIRNIPVRFFFAKAWTDHRDNIIRPLFNKVYPKPIYYQDQKKLEDIYGG